MLSLHFPSPYSLSVCICVYVFMSPPFSLPSFITISMCGICQMLTTLSMEARGNHRCLLLLLYNFIHFRQGFSRNMKLGGQPASSNIFVLIIFHEYTIVQINEAIISECLMFSLICTVFSFFFLSFYISNRYKFRKDKTLPERREDFKGWDECILMSECHVENRVFIKELWWWVQGHVSL